MKKLQATLICKLTLSFAHLDDWLNCQCYGSEFWPFPPQREKIKKKESWDMDNAIIIFM